MTIQVFSYPTSEDRDRNLNGRLLRNGDQAEITTVKELEQLVTGHVITDSEDYLAYYLGAVPLDYTRAKEVLR